VLSAGENRARGWAAALAGAAAAAILAFTRSEAVFYAGYLAAMLVAVLLTPWLALWLARLLRTPLKWMRPVEGSLAVDSLLQAPRRTSATVAALMLSLAMAIGLGGVARASLSSIDEWVRTTLDPDLYVSATPTIAGRGFTFPGGMQAELAAVPGVGTVQAVRTVRIRYGGRPVLLVGLTWTRWPALRAGAA